MRECPQFMDGLINILKPPGMTSHDVVYFLRRLTGVKKVGHTGTLDPAAAGVLPLCLGKATRVIEFLPGRKEYRAEIAFGVKTSTGDSFGEIVYARSTGELTPDSFKRVIPYFTGEIEQIPPMTSAVRHKGVKLYELARRGLEVEREPRRVTIYSIKLVKWDLGAGKNTAIFDVSCSAGTYIRTLCTDIGDRLGCGAHMSFLLRTGVGSFTIDNSYTLEELIDMSRAGGIHKAIINMDELLAAMPAVMVRDSAAASVKSGAKLYSPGVESAPGELAPGQMVRLKSSAGLLAVAAADYTEGRIIFKPVKVLGE